MEACLIPASLMILMMEIAMWFEMMEAHVHSLSKRYSRRTQSKNHRYSCLEPMMK